MNAWCAGGARSKRRLRGECRVKFFFQTLKFLQTAENVKRVMRFPVRHALPEDLVFNLCRRVFGKPGKVCENMRDHINGCLRRSHRVWRRRASRQRRRGASRKRRRTGRLTQTRRCTT